MTDAPTISTGSPSPTVAEPPAPPSPSAPPVSVGLKAIRGCDGCTLCCKVMFVPALQKPSGQWCPHCKTGTGCTIYESRPTECRTFICGYLWFPDITPEWKPAISRMVISSEMVDGSTTIFVDPARPDAWRRQPYYAQLQAWAKRELARGRRLVVKVGERNIVIMSDHAVDLGPMKDELIMMLPKAGSTPQDPQNEVYAVRKDAWDKASFEIAQGLKSPLLIEGLRAGTRLS